MYRKRARVVALADDAGDTLVGTGSDEISVRKGRTYLTVVVDHDSGRLVWAAPGRDGKTVEKFLDLLGKQRCAQIELVSCDMASWITGIAERCPNASVRNFSPIATSSTTPPHSTPQIPNLQPYLSTKP